MFSHDDTNLEYCMHIWTHIMHDVYIYTQFFNGKICIRKSMAGVVSAVTAMDGINSPQISCAKKNHL